MTVTAIVTDSIVTNVIVVDDTVWATYAATLPPGIEMVPHEGEAGIGWSYVDGVFIPPVIPEQLPATEVQS